MTIQERVNEAIKDLPADAPLERVMERLLLLSKIDKGIRQADAGQTLSHDKVAERVAKWQK